MEQRSRKLFGNPSNKKRTSESSGIKSLKKYTQGSISTETFQNFSVNVTKTAKKTCDETFEQSFLR